MARKITWEEHEKRQRLLKRNKKRRDWERAQQNKGWDKAFKVMFALGFVLFGIAWLAVGVAKVVILVSVGILAGVIASYVV